MPKPEKLIKSSRKVDKDGYIRVQVSKDHPYCTTKTGEMYEHRLVMSEYLRRPLLRNETVHHINGDKTDNRIHNLQLRIGGHGPNQTYVCACCGSNILKPVAL